MKEVDVGTVIGGKYALIRLIGAGAMGQVWVARHEALHQSFAVKLMLPPTSESSVQSHETAETTLKRFENEARIAAALSRKSRHIAQVTDYGVDDGVAYLVMELLEGEGLEKRIGDGRVLEPAEVSAVVTQIAKGLSAAHAEGVMHRDLKPANVFLTHDDEGNLLVKLLDFGIARMGGHRLTMKGLVLGSPGYMSPEQAMAEGPDTRADVWSLAVVAYEALAGTTPFHGKDPDQTLLRICNFQPTPLRDFMPEASDDMAAVFRGAFSQNIEERFQTATALGERLSAVLPDPVKKLGQKIYPPTRRLVRPDVPTEIDGGVSLKVPLRPRKVASAIGAGIGVGVLVALALVALRTFMSGSSSSAHAVATPPVVSVSPPLAASVPVIPTATLSAPILDIESVPHTRSGVVATTKTPHAPPVRTQTVSASPGPPSTPPAASTFDRSAIF